MTDSNPDTISCQELRDLPPPTPERSISPTRKRSISPTPERSISPTPERSISPPPERSISPPPERSISPPPERSISPAPLQNSTGSKDSQQKQGKTMKFCFYYLVGLLLLCMMLFFTLFSKISLVNLTNQLRLLTSYNDSSAIEDTDGFELISSTNRDRAVTVYWFIVLILMAPNLFTFLRSFVIGVICKSSAKHLWPNVKLLIIGGLITIAETFVVSSLVFLVFAELPPFLTLFLLYGIGLVQASVNEYQNTFQQCKSIASDKWKEFRDSCTGKHGYELLSGTNSVLFEEPPVKNDKESTRRDSNQEIESQTTDSVPPEEPPVKNDKKSTRRNSKQAIESQTTSEPKENGHCKCTWKRTLSAFLILSLLCSVIIIIMIAVSLISYLKSNDWKIRASCAMITGILFLAVTWTKGLQQRLVGGSNTSESDADTQRYKISFINSSIRLVVYPFATYVTFRFFTLHKIDPWCLNSECAIDLQGPVLPVALIQIFATLCAYITAWIGSAMTLRRPILVALFISTPLTVLTYYWCARNEEVASFFLLNIPEYDYGIDFLSLPSNDFQKASLGLGVFLWFFVVSGLIYGLWSTSKKILAGDIDMFISPSYDGLFFEQQLLLNMKNEIKDKPSDCNNTEHQYKVFICSTMYQESKQEMTELLTSLKNFATSLTTENNSNASFESHIVLDNGVSGKKSERAHFMKHFAIQLFKLLASECGLKKEDAISIKTSYGWCYRWSSFSGNKTFPISIHLKNPENVKSKKRWSQVLYMKYIFHLTDEDVNLTDKNSFILTTDADIGFDKHAVFCLLERMKSNDQIGAVCGRTHPKGSGALYWYQKFDYAIGHWFQKPTEDVLGCVLCCPGCFSMFRCSALKEVIEEYSKPAKIGYEFLTRNMGEDRWLTTLLIEQNYLVVYCALSSISTYCPESFQQFFAQRRRWIPSTIVNLLTLIFKASSITRNSNYISILFIFFQAINIFSTAIAPATVVFVISTGLQSAYNLSDAVNIVIIIFLILIGIIYGVVCVFCSDKVQIDVAKILTFMFTLVMILVIVGLFKESIHSIVPSTTFSKPLNCTVFESNSTQYEECERVAKYLSSFSYIYDGNSIPLPVSPNLLYLGVFAFVFIVTALLHWSEFSDLFFSPVFFLALPLGYFLLPIYSTANIKNQTWGTREKHNTKDEGLLNYLKQLKTKLKSCCTRRKNESGSQVEEGRKDEQMSSVSVETTPDEQADEELMEQKTDEYSGKIKTFFETKDIEEIIILKDDSEDESKLKKSLSQLRTTALAVLVTVNIAWILLLYTVEIPELGIFIKEKRAFQLLFLAVYAFIMIIQFFMMLCHRLITFVHYISSSS